MLPPANPGKIICTVSPNGHARTGHCLPGLPIRENRLSLPPNHGWHIETPWPELTVRRACSGGVDLTRPSHLPERSFTQTGGPTLDGSITRESSRMKTTVFRRTVLAVVACLAATAESRAIEPLVTTFGLGTILHPIQEPDVVPVPAWCE